MPSLEIDEALLQELAGKRTFARGKAYFAEGRVEIVSIADGHVSAKVLGSEVYESGLTIETDGLSGECSCPAFLQESFCKHLVATALAANALTPGAHQHGESRLGRVRDHLSGKSVENLVEMILRLAARDPSLMQSLELTAAVGEAERMPPGSMT